MSRGRAGLGRSFFGALLLLVGATLWINLPAVDSAGSIVGPEVRARMLSEGRARVIVQLRLPGGPHVPEGRLSSAALSVQRSDVAGARAQILARLAKRNYRLLHQYSSVPFVALEIGPDALAELEASSLWVTRVVEDTVNAPTLPQSVPLIGADQDWSRGFDGTGMVVAVVDTGVEVTHPFLAGKVVEEACYSSTVTGRSSTVCPNGLSQQTGPGAGVSCPISSSCWHGTHVAGIAAGNGGGAGVAFSGVAKGAQIMAVQVFSKFLSTSDCGGSAPCVLAWTSDIIAGLERVYAVRGTRNLSSANLSIGGGTSTVPCDGDPTKAIIDNLRSVGIATVVAGGNNGLTNALSAPGCISSAISVGATTKSDAVASYSNAASFLTLFAPGSSIYSSVAGGAFGFASGTSMATPHVTGAWAVLKQAAPAATVDQILSALLATGLPITDTRSGGTVTKPRIQLAQALSALIPTVGSVAPNQGSPGAAVAATITGTGFGSGSTVSFGSGITVSNLAVTSPTQLTATLTIAAGAALGSRDVTVTNSVGGSGTLAGGFTVIGAAVVTVSSVTPAQGAQGAAVPVTIKGAGFAAGATVSVGGTGVTASNVTVGSTTQLTATLSIASGVALGARDVTVINPGGASGTQTGGFTVVAAATVTSVAPGQGAPGATVPVTVTGTGFAAGATLSVSGTGVTVSNVAVASATQLTASLTLAAGAALGARDVTVTNVGGTGGTLAGGFTVANGGSASLTFVYNGMLRDRVGQGNTALAPDGALDGTLTVTLSAPGGRTVTGLRLDSNAPGTWDTSSATAFWILAVAPSLDGAILNAPGSMAVSFPVADGGSFVVFASDYLGSEFLSGRTLTLTATFADGSTATAATTLAGPPVAVNSVTPGQGAPGATVPVTVTGTGFTTGATLSVSGTGVTVSNVAVASATQLTASLTLAAGAAPGARNVTVTNVGGTGGTLAGGFTVANGGSASLTFVYNGMLRDRVGQGNTALAPDGALDGTLTVTLSAPGGRTVTGLRLDSNAPGTWDTSSATAFWILAVAPSLDGAILNAPGSMAVSFPVADGGSFVVFASDYLGSEFLSGRTLTLTATFSDGSTATAATTVPATAPANVTLVYNGMLRDRVGQGNTALAPDGALDGTLTVTLSAPGGRTVTALRLDSNAPGTWDTSSGTEFWALAVAPSLDSAVLNAPGTMAVNFPVADGGSFVVFASDAQGIEFLSGRTLTLMATFADGSTATAVTTVP